MPGDVRKGMPDPHVGKDVFKDRFLARFYDPAFDALRPELERAMEVAWQAYEDSRKAPRTRPAGPEFADPTYDMSAEWLAARDAIKLAQTRHKDQSLPSRVLIINASPRTEHTCPGEMSKTYRLVETARDALMKTPATECDILDLSRVTSEYGRQIHPCKACFSPRRRFATGRAPAIPTTAWARQMTGCMTSIPCGSQPTAS